jgi:hypothetical protein
VSTAEAEVPETPSRWQTSTAILIAIITVFGALITWRASVSDDSAGDEDFQGIQATVNAAQIRTLNYVNGMEHYGSYFNYERFERMSEEFEKAGKTAAHLEVEAADLAAANMDEFPNQYMTRTGDYALNRDLGAMWQDAIKGQEVDGPSHFQAADVYRSKTIRLSITVVVLSLSLIVLTLVEVVAAGAQLPVLLLGALLGFGGTVWAILIELGKA